MFFALITRSLDKLGRLEADLLFLPLPCSAPCRYCNIMRFFEGMQQVALCVSLASNASHQVCRLGTLHCERR